jgi:hypothetical protein
MRTLGELREAAGALLTALAEAKGVIALVEAEAQAAQQALRYPRFKLEKAARPAPDTSEADATAQLVAAITAAARAADGVRERFRRIAEAVGKSPAGSRSQ